MTTRDEFEAWARGTLPLDKEDDGGYKEVDTYWAYKAWRARQQEIDALKARVASFDQWPNVDALRQCMIDTAEENAVLKAEIERLKSRDHIAGISKMILPPVVISCLRFYGNGEHFYIDPDGEGFDTVSGEPENWLCSQREGDTTMFENGGLARAVLRGELTEADPESQPVEGEVYQSEHKLNMVPADNQDALDAARYRYLRDVSCEEEGDGALVVIFRGDWTISIEQAELCGEVLDATIDAQMQHTTEPEE